MLRVLFFIVIVVIVVDMRAYKRGSVIEFAFLSLRRILDFLGPGDLGIALTIELLREFVYELVLAVKGVTTAAYRGASSQMIRGVVHIRGYVIGTRRGIFIRV